MGHLDSARRVTQGFLFDAGGGPAGPNVEDRRGGGATSELRRTTPLHVLETQVEEFGRVPFQLFAEAHPPKLKKVVWNVEALKTNPLMNCPWYVVVSEGGIEKESGGSRSLAGGRAGDATRRDDFADGGSVSSGLGGVSSSAASSSRGSDDLVLGGGAATGGAVAGVSSAAARSSGGVGHFQDQEPAFLLSSSSSGFSNTAVVQAGTSASADTSSPNKPPPPPTAPYPGPPPPGGPLHLLPPTAPAPNPSTAPGGPLRLLPPTAPDEDSLPFLLARDFRQCQFRWPDNVNDVAHNQRAVFGACDDGCLRVANFYAVTE